MKNLLLALLLLPALLFSQTNVSGGSSSSTSLPFVPLIQYAMTDCATGSPGSCPDTSGNGNNGVLTSGSVTTKGLSCSAGSVEVSLPVSVWSSVRTVLIWTNPGPRIGTTNATQNFMSINGQHFYTQASGNVGLFAVDGIPTTEPTRPINGDSFIGIVFGSPMHMYLGPGVGEETAYVNQGNFTPSGTPTGWTLCDITGFRGSFDYRGQVYYFLAFSQALTPAQLGQAKAFVDPILAARGVNVNNGPLNPQVILTGDSITVGGAASNFPNWSQFLNIGQIAANGGFGGQTLAGYSFTGAVDPLIVPRSTIDFVWLGTNDMANNVSAATTYSNIQTACASRKTLQAYCIVSTILPRDATFSGITAANFETQRGIFNIDINTDTTHFDGFSDPGNDPICAAGGVATADLTVCYPDKVHPSIAFQPFIAAYHSNAINAVLGKPVSCNTYTVSATSTNWQFKINNSTTNLQAAAISAATTQSVPFFWVQPRSKVASITVKTTTAWSGTGFTSIKATLGGGTGGTTFYTSLPYEFVTAASDTNFLDSGPLFKSGSSSVGENLTLNLTANQNLNANTITGAADVTVCMVTNK